MYRELLQSCAAGFKSIKIQEPASEKEIARAEKTLGYRFPRELRALLAELNGDKWLLFSVDEIIATWRDLSELSECYPGADKRIYFAGNGCGDYYCYQADADGAVREDAIYIWNHEDNETCVVAKNLAEMITRCYHDEI